MQLFCYRPIVGDIIVMTAGEFMGLHAPVGMPVVVSDSGWERVIVPEMWREEKEMLRQAATRIQAKVEEWLEG